MISSKRCSDDLAEFSIYELKDEYKNTIFTFYCCHVGGVIAFLLVFILCFFKMFALSSLFLPIFKWLNITSKNRLGELRIIKSAINYRESKSKNKQD